MTESKYFKAVTDKGTKFYAVNEDDTIAEFYLEDMRADGVHIDSDQSWHWHDYDLSLINAYDVDSLIELISQSASLTNDGLLQALEDDINYATDNGDVFDITDAVNTLAENADYYTVAKLYSLINDDPNSTIKAFTVNGYSQGDGAFVWYDTSMTEGVYTPEYVESVLYDMWYAIDLVGDDGVILDNAEYVTYVDNDYMKEHFNAVPAMETVTMQLS